MSWSLRLRGGDLNLSGKEGYATVRSGAKLLQDLRNWTLEPRGTDPLHPQFGSTLDGGMSRGVQVDSLIGSTISQEVLLDIEVEIRRILSEYRRQQANRVHSDMMKFGGRHTVDQGEGIDSIEDIQVRQVNDTVLIRVTIRTSSGARFSLTQPVGST